MSKLTATLCLTLLFPALAYGETMYDLVMRDGIHYKKFSTVPFTGKVTGIYQGSIKNGIKDGNRPNTSDLRRNQTRNTYNLNKPLNFDHYVKNYIVDGANFVSDYCIG